MDKQLILRKTMHIDAPVSKVWEALTSPALIKQYFFGTTVISDWKVGSPIRFTGTWEGKEYEDKGTVLKFEKGKVFQYNYWSSFSPLPDLPENYSVLTFELTPHGSTTELLLTQDNIPNEAALEHTGKNWDGVLGAMKKLVEK